MAEQVISPDLNFVKDIIRNGGESLKKCYQCATCSVVCNVTPDSKPFPRKEMMWAQWGLKDKLLDNPDVWLCHQCSDCTAYCPRGAKPGEVLQAVRKLTISHYSIPNFLGRAVGDQRFLIILFLVPVVILLTILGSLGHLNISEIPRGEDGGIVYSKFMPVPYIDTLFGLAAAFAVFSFIMGVYRYWKAISRNEGIKGGDISKSLISTISEILLHKRFKKCDVTKARAKSHLYVFYGFVGLAITTTWAIAYLYGYEFFGITASSLFHFGESPYPLYDPLKILGNLSALALIVGITLVVLNRLANKDKAGIGSYFDWLFITVVFVIAATGILTELTRLANIAVLAYPIYFIHLTFVFFLFAYAPFSKMAHMVYRTTAMVFARQTGREV